MVDQHPTHPYVWLVRLLLAMGSGRRGSDDPTMSRSSVWQCPGHIDAGPSLAVSVSRDGERAILHCYAGCAPTAVLAAIRMPMRYLRQPPSICPERFAQRVARAVEFPPVRDDVRGGPGRNMRLEAEHAYGSPAVAWLMRYRHPVTGAKSCSWESLNHRGERVLGLCGRDVTALPLYLEREAVAAVALGEPVVVVESESSADALVRAGVLAVTWAGGAGSPEVDALRRVLGAHERVLVMADADEPGRRCAARIAAALPLARVHHPEVEGNDARDVLSVLGRAHFREVIEKLTSTSRERSS